MMNISTTPKAVVGVESSRGLRRTPDAVQLVRSVLIWVSAMLVAIVASLWVLDSVVFPSMEDQRKLGASGWFKENKKLFQLNSWRNWASKEKPLWTSGLYPIDVASKKAKRILVIGDSYVWGDGYANLNDIWWRQLERELQSRGYNQVEVIAAGYPGASTKEELSYAKSVVPKYKPDLIIWGYAGDDPDEGVVRQIFLPPEPLFDRLCAVLSRPFPNLTIAMQTWRSRQRMLELSGPRYGYDYSTWEMKLLEGENWQKYKQTVADLASFQHQTGIPAFALTLPNSPNESYFKTRYPKAKELFEANGIPFHDTLPSLVREFGGADGLKAKPVALSVNPLNGHPGAAETHVFAAQAADLLESKYRACLGASAPNTASHSLHINDAMPPVLMSVTEPHPGEVHFNYPLDNSYTLTMPVRKPYVQFDLETPAPVKAIQLSGNGLKGAMVYTTHLNKERNSDDGLLQTLPWKSGRSLSWDLGSSDELSHPINTIRISAKFDGPDRKLVLFLLPRP